MVPASQAVAGLDADRDIHAAVTNTKKGSLPMRMTNFAGKTIGLMVANGFDEATFIAIQKAMLAANAKLKIISRDAGLTNAWNGTGWGMSYPVDSTLSTTLAVDYDALIIPQGDRHIEKLSNEVHAKRILRAFLRENMPVLILADAIKILDIVDMGYPEFVDGANVARAENLAVTSTYDIVSGLDMLNEIMLGDQGKSRAA